MLINLNGSTGTFPVRRSGLTLECGAPVPLWIWYDVTNIQQMPEYGSFAPEPKRRRVAALQRLFHNHKEPKIQIPRHNGEGKIPALNSPDLLSQFRRNWPTWLPFFLLGYWILDQFLGFALSAGSLLFELWLLPLGYWIFSRLAGSRFAGRVIGY